MSSSPGFLEFFILEASEYVEELDGLLNSGGATGPNADALHRIARALRGTATMAKIPPFADLAGGVERVGRSLREGALQWEPALAGAVTATVDELKTLLHAARNWSPADARRATERAAELARFAPVTRDSATPIASRAHSFLATEASNIAAGLELLTTRPSDGETAANVLRRVRALRGVAAVKEVTPLAEVLEATEDATRGLELEGRPLSADAVELLTAAGVLLRRVATVLRDLGDANTPSAERERFSSAYDQWSDNQIERQRVVPIAELFFGDNLPGVVDEAKSPPTSMAERFRLELVSQGEHLRGIVSSARAATDGAASGRARRVLRQALRSIEATAESYGHDAIARHVHEYAAVTNRLDAADLASLEDLADRLSEPGVNGERVIQATTPGQPRPTGTPRAMPAVPSAPDHPPRAPQEPRGAPAHAPAHAHAHAHALAPTASLDVLNASIAALESISARPFAEPVDLGDEPVVPIEVLTYRGRAALARAVEIRDELRRTGSTPDASALEELFDLLELAQVE